jgi:hydrogenase-4 component E
MPGHSFGASSYDLAHLLGGAVLVLSFGLLYQRRLNAVINLYALQALALAAAAFWQGWVQDSTDPYLAGAITLVANCVAIPMALHEISNRLRVSRTVDTALSIFPSLVLGVALVGLAILVVLPGTAPPQALTREDMALALSVVLLGLLMMVTRRGVLIQVIGFLSLGNGLILAAIAVPGLPLVVALTAAILVLVAALVAGVFFFPIREHFDRPDVAHRNGFGEMPE